MRFEKYLNEKIKDDVGKAGKKFETVFLKACELVGLDFEKNSYAGSLWDFKTKGSGWNRFVASGDVNIKTYRTKWMFGTSELSKMLPWEELPKEWNSDKASAKIKRYLNKLGLPNIVFLKPKTEEIQASITKAVNSKDVVELDKLLIKKNFSTDKLGKGYKVRVLDNGKRVTSIAIDKSNKVFMRTERPRELGGSLFTAFRTPTIKLGKEKEVKNEI